MTFRIDLHVHTDASPDGLSPLPALTAAAKAAGLSAIAVTDHDRCSPVPEQQNGVLLIPGCEVSTREGHILGLFLEEALDLGPLRRAGLPTGAAAVAEIRRRGGVAVLAHPYQSRQAAPEAFAFRPDAVEGANARACFKVGAANEKAAALARRWGLPATGGSDAHARQEVGNACTQVDCGELTLPALKAAVLGGNCRPVLLRDTPCYRKGLSQLGKAYRTGNVFRVAKGLAYLGYCGGKDLLRLQRKAQPAPRPREGGRQDP